MSKAFHHSPRTTVPLCSNFYRNLRKDVCCSKKLLLLVFPFLCLYIWSTWAFQGATGSPQHIPRCGSRTDSLDRGHIAPGHQGGGDDVMTTTTTDVLMRLPAVLQVFPVSRSGWYEGVRTGRYPCAGQTWRTAQSLGGARILSDLVANGSYEPVPSWGARMSAEGRYARCRAMP